jgi:paraquat-inducible protein A
MSARDPLDAVPRAHQLGVVACHDCGLVCGADPAAHPSAPAHLHAPHAAHAPHCPRCGAPLHRRRPDSIARTWAFLVAALIMYIPANLYPVMNTTLLGSGAESTILNGVIEFWKSGSYGIALVIFIASVAVPCTKFLVLAILLVMAQRRSGRAVRERAKLYRMIEFIGYWSMLDVMVVGVTSAAIKFGAIGDAEPRIGILFFGLVVILTMLAAMNFDPRLNWDGQKQ